MHKSRSRNRVSDRSLWPWCWKSCYVTHTSALHEARDPTPLWFTEATPHTSWCRLPFQAFHYLFIYTYFTVVGRVIKKSRPSTTHSLYFCTCFEFLGRDGCARASCIRAERRARGDGRVGARLIFIFKAFVLSGASPAVAGGKNRLLLDNSFWSPLCSLFVVGVTLCIIIK